MTGSEHMTFKQVCQLGFNCPYHRFSEGDELCIYPYIQITEKEEEETFGFPEEGDCPLLEFDSPLEKWKRLDIQDDGSFPVQVFYEVTDYNANTCTILSVFGEREIADAECEKARASMKNKYPTLLNPHGQYVFGVASHLVRFD